MAAICKNDFQTFHKFMDKRKNPIPI